MPGPSFNGKTVILGVTGSIAAYKAVALVRMLVQEGIDVHVVMTEAARQFVSPLTYEVLSKHPVPSDLFSGHATMAHLSLPAGADALVIAPATANILAKSALGLADDLLSTMLLTTQCPVIYAPAMDGGMWDHPAVQAHVHTLRGRGHTVIDPECGPLASGCEGQGRMCSESAILAALKRQLVDTQDWGGQRVLISAGPTHEPIDAVRFISNRSSGKMGYALAHAAVERGAKVVLVSGPTALKVPTGVDHVPVQTAEEMEHALSKRFDWSTVLIMAAAVSDFRPAQRIPDKIKKAAQRDLQLNLVASTDILSSLAQKRTHQLLVGFAAETDDLVAHAQKKLNEKHLDLVIGNHVDGETSPFGSDTNEVVLISRAGGHEYLARMPKSELAHRILDAVHTLHLPSAQADDSSFPTP